MRIFIIVLFLILNLQSWTKADDIRELEIEGISIGDSALDFFSKDIIDDKKIFYPNSKKFFRVLICGGGRKNKTLLKGIKQYTLKNIVLQSIDDFGVDGDFVESQAFAYLAIRNLINEPISFPNTTGCLKPLIGGILIKN